MNMLFKDTYMAQLKLKMTHLYFDVGQFGPCKKLSKTLIQCPTGFSSHCNKESGIMHCYTICERTLVGIVIGYLPLYFEYLGYDMLQVRTGGKPQ